MKKTFIFSLFTIAVAGFIASYASADSLIDNGATGGDLSIATANVATAAGAVTFTPSTKVRISGGSSAGSFGMASYHTGVVGKKAAQAYGMSADSNKQFVLDISDVGDNDASDAILVIGDTNSSAFAAPWVSI